MKLNAYDSWWLQECQENVSKGVSEPPWADIASRHLVKYNASSPAGDSDYFAAATFFYTGVAAAEIARELAESSSAPIKLRFSGMILLVALRNWSPLLASKLNMRTLQSLLEIRPTKSADVGEQLDLLRIVILQRLEWPERSVVVTGALQSIVDRFNPSSSVNGLDEENMLNLIQATKAILR